MSDLRLTIMEAIAGHKLVDVCYNGSVVRLAPHLLFERHGDLFIYAGNVGKARRIDEEPRLGQFKLAGLGEARLTGESFDLLDIWDGSPPRDDDQAVLAA